MILVQRFPQRVGQTSGASTYGMENTASESLETRKNIRKEMWFSGGEVMERFHYLNEHRDCERKLRSIAVDSSIFIGYASNNKYCFFSLL